MHVNLQILYPTVTEERNLGLGPSVDLNSFVDAILTIVFDHARTQRAQSPDAVRSIVFSSYNPSLCTALNWKQPNFPVFLCNDLGRQDVDAGPDGIKSSGRRTSSIKEVVRTAQNNNLMGLICCSRLLVSFPMAFWWICGIANLVTGHGARVDRRYQVSGSGAGY
jgi:CDK inhibitor PHO81